MQLTWQQYDDPIFGRAYRLDGLPCPQDSGVARRHGDTRYVAMAFITGRYLSHHAGTVHAAIKRLNAEIDKRSIGLLGVDDVAFATT